MHLTPPYGLELKQLLAPAERARALRREASSLPSWDLTPRQVCDLELLMSGAFSPLTGFLGEADYARVCREMRLVDGPLWPMPITLDVREEWAADLKQGDRVALRHPEGMVLALLTISDIWRPDRMEEAQRVFGTNDETHPAVFNLAHQTNPVYLGGPVEGVELPPHHTFAALRHTPAELRAEFQKRGWHRIVAFQTRSPMHCAQAELARRAAQDAEASTLIHPVVGLTKPDDADCYSRVRCYKAVLKHLPEATTMLSLLPLAMRMGGPREAVWHSIIRRNYGCSHLIVGRNHADPGTGSAGKPFYGPCEAQELVRAHEDELGITMLAFEEMVFVEDRAEYVQASAVPQGSRVLSVSSTEFRRRLREGLELPHWFSYPEVIAELRRSFPPRVKQGLTFFFTGLSGSGKSTIAHVLLAKLLEQGTRPVTLLDGDVVRKHLSSELGFSKKDRDLNITRIGFVASEITRNRGIAICAPIAPYRAARRVVREMISEHGGFIEVHVSTPIEECEARDRKGLYAKARAGLLKGFTGIDDPYEVPENPEVVVDTRLLSAEEAAHSILLYARKEGYLADGEE
jgi:sulfate adenylyltransferase